MKYSPLLNGTYVCTIRFHINYLNMKKFENGLKLICPRTLGPFDRIMPELY